MSKIHLTGRGSLQLTSGDCPRSRPCSKARNMHHLSHASSSSWNWLRAQRQVN